MINHYKSLYQGIYRPISINEFFLCFHLLISYKGIVHLKFCIFHLDFVMKQMKRMRQSEVAAQSYHSSIFLMNKYYLY
jgi:hypothetical protein